MNQQQDHGVLLVPHSEQFVGESLSDHFHASEVEHDPAELLQSGSKSPRFVPAQEITATMNEFDPRSGTAKLSFRVSVLAENLFYRIVGFIDVILQPGRFCCCSGSSPG